MNLNGAGIGRLVVALVGAAIIGCGGTGTETYTKTINTFDAFGDPVAQFRFTQSDGDVSLVIESTSNRVVSMTYNVDFLLNLAAWQHQGSVQFLASGSSRDVGVISGNPARVDWGTILITITSLSYQ